MSRWSAADLARHQAQHRSLKPPRLFIDEAALNPPVSKFRSQRTAVDGIWFASKAEAARFAHLKLLEKAQQLHDLELQPRFELHVNGELLGVVIFDFAYRTGVLDARVIEDVKGYEVAKNPATRFSKWKRRHCEIEYGITIQVIR